MRQVRRALVITVVAVAGLAGAAPALATTQSAQSGNVKATFTFHGTAPNYSRQRLRIERAGKVVYDKPVVARRCGHLCGPGGVHSSSVHVLDLEHNARPDVVLDLFSGGAHCCFIEQVFSYAAAANTYRRTERDFGDPGAQIKDLGHDGRFEFLSADDRFANRFTDFADSGLPIQICFQVRAVNRRHAPLPGADRQGRVRMVEGVHYEPRQRRGVHRRLGRGRGPARENLAREEHACDRASAWSPSRSDRERRHVRRRSADVPAQARVHALASHRFAATPRYRSQPCACW